MRNYINKLNNININLIKQSSQNDFVIHNFEGYLFKTLIIEYIFIKKFQLNCVNNKL